jgi:hypothetical protein
MKELNTIELEEAEAKIRSEHGDLDLAHVKIRGLGSVIVLPPSRGDLTRFQRKVGGAGKRGGGDTPAALEELARCCVAYPKVDELDKAIESKRKYGAWVAIGSAAIELSGAGAEEVSGN